MRRRGTAATKVNDAILQFLVDTSYGSPDVAAAALQALTELLFTVMVQTPFPIPGSGLSLLGFPDGLKFRDGKVDWNLPVAEICSDLRKVFEHLAEWKRVLSAEHPAGVTILQSGAPIRVAVRMSIGNDGTSPHRHFLALQGPPKDVFLAITLLLLANSSSANVATCPGCDRVFVRGNARQTHCHKNCYNRQYWRETYTPQQKAEARLAQYQRNGWSLGAKGSPLGRLKAAISLKSKRQSSSNNRGD
jgi:hypothetical protein